MTEAAVAINLPVGFALVLVPLRLTPVLDIQPFARLVQHRVQPLADRRPVAAVALDFATPLDPVPSILAQGLAQSFLRPAPVGALRSRLRHVPFRIVASGDPRQSFPEIVRLSLRAAILRSRRPERRQTGRDAPLPFFTGDAIGLPRHVQSLAHVAEGFSRLTRGMDHGPALRDRHILPALALGGCLFAPLHGVRRRSQLQLRVAVQLHRTHLVPPVQRRLALLLQRPVIDPLMFPGLLQRPVLQFGPDAAHLLDLDTPGLRGVEHAGLGREPLRLKLPGGGQDVGVMVALVALPVRCVDRHIDGHPIAPDQLLREVADDPRPLGRADLGRQGQLPFAPGDGVTAGLAGLGRVPERGPVLRPGRGTVGGDDERLLDALLGRVVVQTALALALDALARAVGGGGNDGAPGRKAFTDWDGPSPGDSPSPAPTTDANTSS